MNYIRVNIHVCRYSVNAHEIIVGDAINDSNIT